MPFTFSHPAIILPLAKLPRNRISATGLIIGSMAPDFEFFLRMKLQKIHGHTFEGVFYYDLPLSILLAFLFHFFVRDALISYSPQPVKANFSQFVGLDWLSWFRKYWYVYLYSALIGIFSHLLWDAFTHESGFFAQRIPFLLEESTVFMWEMPNYMIGQLGGSLAGGALILIVLVFPKQSSYSSNAWKNMLTYWSMVVAIVLIVLILRNIQSLGDFIAATISGGLIGLLITPRLMKLLKINEGPKILNKGKD